MRDPPSRGGSGLTPSEIVVELTVLVLAVFLGFEVIAKVPTLLHTPLMSGTNAIHGIVLVGAIIVAGLPDQDAWIRVVSLVAVALGTMNVVGGFVVTDRMLEMFKKRDPEESSGVGRAGGRLRLRRPAGAGRSRRRRR